MREVPADAIAVDHEMPPKGVEVLGFISDPAVAINNFPAVVRWVPAKDGPEWWSGVPGQWIDLRESRWSVTHWKPIS